MGMLLEEQMSCWKMQKQINKLDVLLKFLLGQTGATGGGGEGGGVKELRRFYLLKGIGFRSYFLHPLYNRSTHNLIMD